ncbi:MAG: cobalamin-independent methionine synthase II family protein [Candidatus Dormibacteraceae bacterium]
MLTATKDLLLPTTVTGSWPRPSWFDASLYGRPFSSGMADLRYRERFVDAVSSVISDQELAGLDIVTDGDFHLDHDLAGRSWFSYPTERLSGISEHDIETTAEWTYPVGSWLNEIVGGWKYHAVLGKVGPRVPLEFAKIWRVAQARAHRPVKFGTVAADMASSVLTLRTDAYTDKHELMWDLAGILNQELRALAAAGCRVIQIEEPSIHSQAAFGASAETLNFLVDLFNRTVEGLEGTEVWIHTCWGNPGAQNCFPPDISYEASLDIYLNRLKGDVWTIESKENGHRLLPAFAPYKNRLPKKVAVGFISHRQLQVESPEEIAADVRRALEYIDAEHLVLSSDCGFGRQGVPRAIALYKAAALAQGANIVRRELGAPVTPVPAADPALQVDVPAVPPGTPPAM